VTKALHKVILKQASSLVILGAEDFKVQVGKAQQSLVNGMALNGELVPALRLHGQRNFLPSGLAQIFGFLLHKEGNPMQIRNFIDFDQM